MRSDRQLSLHVQLILFFGLSLISWVIWVPQALAALGYSVSAVPLNSPLNALAVWAPGLAAIVVCALVAGKAGVRALVRPIRYRHVGIGWYPFVILYPAGLWALAVGIDRLSGWSYELGRSPVFDVFGPQAVLMLPFIIVLALPNALGEELGWRGFALPRLQTKYAALTASIVIGLFWGLWHIPTWAAQNPKDVSAWSSLWMVLSTMPAAVVFTWVYNNTSGSLLLVWLLHASTAITGYFTPVLPTHTHTVLSWTIAITIVGATGPTRLSRHAAAHLPGQL